MWGAATVIIHGHPDRVCMTQWPTTLQPTALKEVCLDSHQRLGATVQNVVLVEGAGSPAEINLRAGEYCQYGLCRGMNCPVI